MDELEDYSEYNGIIHNKSIINNNFHSNYSEYNGLLPSNFMFFEDNFNELIPYDFKFNDDMDLDPISLNHLFKDKSSSNLPWDKLDGFCYLSKDDDYSEKCVQEDDILDNRLNKDLEKGNIETDSNDFNKKENEKNGLNRNILKKICDLEGIVFEKVKNPNNIIANHNIIKNNIVQYIKMVENHLIGSILSFMIEKLSPVKLDDLVIFLKDKIENMRKSNGCKYSENIHKVIYSTLISNKIFKKNRINTNNQFVEEKTSEFNQNQNQICLELFYFDENEATEYILNTIEKEIENSQKIKRILKNKNISTISKPCDSFNKSLNMSNKKFKDENNCNLLSFLPFSNNSYKSSVSSKKKDSNIDEIDIEMTYNKSKKVNINKEENSINSTIITDNFTNSSNYSSLTNNHFNISSKHVKKSSNNLNSIKKKVNKVYEILDDLLTKLVNKNELESCIISNLKKSKDEFEIVKQLGDDNCCMGIIVCLKFFKKTIAKLNKKKFKKSSNTSNNLKIESCLKEINSKLEKLEKKIDIITNELFNTFSSNSD